MPVKFPISNSEPKHKSMIKIRGGFSERMGFKPCNTQMQLTEFDDRTRTLIGNHLYKILGIVFSHASNIGIQCYQSAYDGSVKMSSDFCRDVFSEVMNVSTHLPHNSYYDWEQNYKKFVKIISDAPYNEVLDFLWYICQWIKSHTLSSNTINEIHHSFNELFEREYVGYRFVAGEIVPITDETEMQEIEKACQTPFEGARAQFQKALGFLSDRDHPDYKNCIKESISAVESVCETIVGSDNGATLGKAVKHLEEHGLKIHSSLREGISKLYGYACDQGGVRHGEGEVESTVTFEEAKLMMVTCSAIVNYLVAEYGKHGAENA